MSTPLAPPPAAERLVRAAIRDPEWRDAVAGDLREEFLALVRRRGGGAARRWYWSQALRLTGRFALSRLVPAAAPSRRFTVADADTPGAGVGWTRECRHAWRALTRRPALSTVIVVTLGVSLAANATIFNLTDALYLRPFRFPGAERAVVVASAAERDPLADRSSVSPADFRDWSEHSRALTNMAAADFWDPNLSEIDEPEQLSGFRVSPSFFRALGVEPMLGRGFTDAEGEPGHDRRVLVSHDLWTGRFGADPSLVGRSLRLDGEPYEVIGIMPPGIKVPYGAKVWAPLAMTGVEWQERRRGWLLVVGRLADSASLQDASAEMTTLVGRQGRDYPETNAKREVTVQTLTRGLGDAGAGPFLMIWQAAALLLLFIACANIANLLLARGAERQAEFAIRLALGASRRRLAAQVLIEGGWLALAAVGLSLPLAVAGVAATRQALPSSVLRWVAGYEFLAVDVSVLAVTGLLAVVATLLFSLLPALNAAGAAVSDSLRQGARTVIAGHNRQWARMGLASAQVALTVALIVAAGLITGAVDNAVNGTLGFDKRQVMTARLTLPDRPYADAEKRRRFIASVLDRVRTLPAVESAGMVSELPYAGSSTGRSIYPEGVELTPAEVRSADFRRVAPGYFETLRLPLVEGRLPDDHDRSASRAVAVVSRDMADRYWPGASALGRRFKTAPDGPWIEVVGVVGDIKHDWFMNQRRPTFYRPAAQDAPFGMAFVVRTIGEPLDVAGELRRAVAAADPDQPILRLASMETVVADKAGGITYLAQALSAMSGIALLLSLMGVYSLMAFLVTRRTQEIGVRMALGASRWQVIRLTAGQAVVITVTGVTLGTGLALGVGRLMESVLFGLVSMDLARVAVMVVALATVALAAGVIPARRAATLDPTVALRAD